MKKAYESTSEFIKRTMNLKRLQELNCIMEERKRGRVESSEEEEEEEEEEERDPSPSRADSPYPERNNKRKTDETSCYDDKSKRKPCETNKLLGIPPPGTLGPVAAPIAPVVGAAPAPAPLAHIVEGEGFTIPVPLTGITPQAVIVPLTTIPLGTTLHSRSSTRLTVRNVSVKGQVRNAIVSGTPDATVLRPELRKLRILVVVDHNGRNEGADPPELPDVLSYALPDRSIPYTIGSIVAHYNYNTNYRFTVLLDRTITLGSWTGTAGDPKISPPYSVDYDYSVKSCFELTYATDSDIPTKNEHILYLVGTDDSEPDSVQNLETMYSVQLQFE